MSLAGETAHEWLVIIMVTLPVSGIMMAKHTFHFIHFRSGAASARLIHLLASYWGFVCAGILDFIGMRQRQHIQEGRLTMTGTEGKEMICKLETIQRPDDLVSLVKRLGFIPFFQDGIAGYSIDEATPASMWDENLGLGPWLWRDDIAREKQCIYGKFFHKKTGYISAEWFPHFANYRREGYDFDARYDDGMARYEDKRI